MDSGHLTRRHRLLNRPPGFDRTHTRARQVLWQWVGPGSDPILNLRRISARFTFDVELGAGFVAATVAAVNSNADLLSLLEDQTALAAV